MEEQNNQPLVITAIIASCVLIIALAFIFTRGDTVESDIADENNVTESGEENGDNGQQPEPVPPPAPEPAPEPTPPPAPEPAPTSGLPPNWDSLTAPEKTDLNPFNCDLETQIVYADDGTCHDKPEEIPRYRRLSRYGRDDCLNGYYACEIILAVDECSTDAQLGDILREFEDIYPVEDEVTVTFHKDRGLDDLEDYWDLDSSWPNPCPDIRSDEHAIGGYTRTTKSYIGISRVHACDDVVGDNYNWCAWTALVKGDLTEAQLDAIWQVYLPEEDKSRYDWAVLRIYRDNNDGPWYKLHSHTAENLVKSYEYNSVPEFFR